MMAVLSTAWVLPGLAGPALAAEVAHRFGLVVGVLGLLPIVAVAGSIAVPALSASAARRGPGGRAPAGRRHPHRGRLRRRHDLAGLSLAAASGATRSESR